MYQLMISTGTSVWQFEPTQRRLDFLDIAFAMAGVIVLIHCFRVAWAWWEWDGRRWVWRGWE